MLLRLKRRHRSKQKTWFDKYSHQCMSVSNKPAHCWGLFISMPWSTVWKAALKSVSTDWKILKSLTGSATNRTRLDRKLLVSSRLTSRESDSLSSCSQTQKSKSIQKLNYNNWTFIGNKQATFQPGNQEDG